MDSLIAAAAQALASGDALGALKRVALRDDAPALALRGIAMAQIGDLVRARQLLRRAIRAFGPKESAARARCVVAEAEIALASRELPLPDKALAAALATLEEQGDWKNATHARYIEVQRLVLTGHLRQAERLLAHFEPASLPLTLRVHYELLVAGIAIRRVQATAARAALARAEHAAREANLPALTAEVETAHSVLEKPAALLLAHGQALPVRLDRVEALLRSDKLIIDGCRHVVRNRSAAVGLATRPVLFALARTLALGWPGEVSREILISEGFGARFRDESHRHRLRVEVGRLRKLLGPLADIRATKTGFKLIAYGMREVVVLAQPVATEHGAVLALLADGESWSSSALAIALGISQRSAQRALDALAATGTVQFFGRARARRWLMPSVPGFTTTLLLPEASSDLLG